MGIFGPSKKEKTLMNEVERLKAENVKLYEMIHPDYAKLQELTCTIEELTHQKEILSANIENLNKSICTGKTYIDSLNKEMLDKQHQLSVFNVELTAQEYGLYKPAFEFANSDLYKEVLSGIRNQEKEYINSDKAATSVASWTVNGSEAKGKAMVKDIKKLLLRAFNIECDDIVANVKVSNLNKSIERVYKIGEQISKLGATMSISICEDYIKLKIREIKLALDFQQKKQEEKEHQKELREQERELAKVAKEMEEERKRLQKEQTHYKNALKTIEAQINKGGDMAELLEKKKQIESQIEKTESAIENVDYREANNRAGYVYIISNIGAFGENVYKIGMTRRLDPQERIDELGDASVPFKFDIHAMIFTEDAPALEAALHNKFDAKRLNKINNRKEFFNVSLEEIKKEVRNNFDKTVEWIDVPEADQYRQSLLV